jgi:uncharacterized cupredoxin-like copper-binding protein/Cu/Ag efflux protein CusF
MALAHLIQSSFAILLPLALLVPVTIQVAQAHGAKAHGPKSETVAKEQKDWGIAGDPPAVKRTITVRMDDKMRFEPDRIEIQLGETVRFIVRNTGQLMHEFVIGTQKELDAHAAMMMKHPNMEHDEPYMAHVAPGQEGEIVWQFNRAGSFGFACLIAGHYQAGMVGRIDVRPAARSSSVTDGIVLAQHATGSGHSSHAQAGRSGGHSSHEAAGGETSRWAEGEVRRIDREGSRITLRHGELPDLDMPPMTMVFRVPDLAWLEGLKPGDRVRFKVRAEAGTFTLTAIEAAR